VEARGRTEPRRSSAGGSSSTPAVAGNLTGNQEGLRIVHPRLKKLAVFGHFTGVRVSPGRRVATR
jgi:hypothetical protein